MATTKNADIILCEGITEKYYINSLRDILVVRPEVRPVKPYNMDELRCAIEECAKVGYTAVHCFIDMDNKVNNAKNMDKYLKLKQKYDGGYVKKTECKVYFYESLPSIELFFYYYFENSTAEKTNDGLKSWLKHKCGYETKPTFSFHNTFTRNGGCIKNAISNSKNSVRLRLDKSYNCSYTEVSNLIEYLGLK